MAVRRGPQRAPAHEAPARTTRPHDDGHGFTILLVPREGHGEVKQLSLSLRSLRRGLVAVGVGAGLLLALCIVGFYSVFRVSAHEDLIAENLFLRGRLEDVESKLTRVDAAIRRVMIYDSELRDAIGESPARSQGVGPLDPSAPRASEPANGAAPTEAAPEGAEPAPGGPSGQLQEEAEDWGPMDGHMEEEFYEEERSASVWAVSITNRADEMLRRLGLLEPRLSKLAEDVQDFVAVSAAFPSLWPADGVLTSPYGYRKGPLTRRRKFHSGIDIGAPRGTQVRASAAGVIESAEWHSGYGRMVLIDHGYGIRTLYGHNTSLFVREGDWVEQGQVIATVGSTGQSTGPHLHFEVWLDGEAVDPLEYVTN